MMVLAGSLKFFALSPCKDNTWTVDGVALFVLVYNKCSEVETLRINNDNDDFYW